MKQHSVVERYFVTVETKGFVSTLACSDYLDMARQFLRQVDSMREKPWKPFAVKGGIIRQACFGVSYQIMHSHSQLFEDLEGWL